MAFDKVREDIRVFNIRHRDQNRWLRYLYFPDFRTVLLIRFGFWCFSHHLKPVAYIITLLNDLIAGVWVGPRVTFGKGLFLGHARGLVVNPGAVVGDYCTLLQQVGLGGPQVQVGNYVSFGAGAKAISTETRPIRIGDFVKIGAGAVITKDVPDFSIVGGVPARVLRRLTLEEIKQTWGNFMTTSLLDQTAARLQACPQTQEVADDI